MFTRMGDGGEVSSGERWIFAFIPAFTLSFAPPVHAQSGFLERRTVQSSDLASVGYDARRRVIEIEFHSGGIYRCLDVPKDVFAALLAAESKGRFFAAHSGGQFRHERLRPGSASTR